MKIAKILKRFVIFGLNAFRAEGFTSSAEMVKTRYCFCSADFRVGIGFIIFHRSLLSSVDSIRPEAPDLIFLPELDSLTNVVAIVCGVKRASVARSFQDAFGEHENPVYFFQIVRC